MYELVKVRVYAVGPSQARFDATLDLRIASTRNPTSLGDDNGDREAFIASLITGLNAAGKTLLASMIQVALEPRLLDQYIANSRWHDIVAANRIGQIILECRQTRDGKRLIIGLAMERQTSGARPNVGHYIIHPERDFDLDLLVLKQPSATLPTLRDHISRIITAYSSTDLVWVSEINDWSMQIGSFGLSSNSICLINDDHPGTLMRFRTDLDFITELIRHLVSSSDMASLAQLSAEAHRNQEAEVTLKENLSKIVSNCIDALPMIERISELPSGAAGRAHRKNLIRFTFSRPTRNEIEQRTGEILEELVQTVDRNNYKLVAKAVQTATENSVRVDFWRPAGNGQYISFDKTGVLPGYEIDLIYILTYLVFVRLKGLQSGMQDQGCIVLMDEWLRSTEQLPNLTEIMLAWQIQIIYLSVRVDGYVTVPIYSLHATTRPDSDEPLTVITPATRLMTLRSQAIEDSSDLAVSMETISVDQVFEVLATPNEMKPGDLLVPTVRRVGETRPVQIVSEISKARRTNLEIILRPREPFNMGEDLFYASYLGSEALLGEHSTSGQIILITPEELAQVQLPPPDREAFHAISELTTASKMFDSWRRDADNAVRSFFQWRDPASARANIIETGRKTRQRREATHMLDDAGPRFRTTLPYPIARRWRDVEAAAVDESGYRRILDCAEATVTYCAGLGLAFASAHSIVVSRLRAIANKLPQSQGRPSFGDWSSVLDNLAEIALSASQPADSPLQNYRCFVGDTKNFIKDLKKLRNDAVHGRGPANHEMPTYISDAKAKLESVLRVIEWLVDYPVRYLESEHWDSFSDVSMLSYRELMGDHNVVSLEHGETSGHLESSSTYAVSQFGRYYLMRPFFHTEYCRSCSQLSVFVIDAWDPENHRAVYKSLDHSHVTQLADAAPGMRAVGLLLP